MTRISLCDEDTRNEDGATERDAGYHTEDLELCVTEEWHDLRQVHITREVSEDTANSENHTSPGVCILLLVSWCVIHNKGADSGLDCRNQPVLCRCGTMPTCVD